MKKLKEYIIDVVDKLTYRENIEWSNFWWDSADKSGNERYLIIGDSTARMLRSSFAKEIGKPVDMVGSSSNIDDILFVNQIDAFFASSHYQYYECIFIQLGHHGRTGKDGEIYREADFERYKHNMALLIDFLHQHTNKIVVESIFDSVIDVNCNSIYSNYIRPFLFKYGVVKETKDQIINEITRRKNMIAHELVLSNNNDFLTWLDINKFSDEMKLSHIDHIHFAKSARSKLAHIMVSAL